MPRCWKDWAERDWLSSHTRAEQKLALLESYPGTWISRVTDTPARATGCVPVDKGIRVLSGWWFMIHNLRWAMNDSRHFWDPWSLAQTQWHCKQYSWSASQGRGQSCWEGDWVRGMFNTILLWSRRRWTLWLASFHPTLSQTQQLHG